MPGSSPAFRGAATKFLSLSNGIVMATPIAHKGTLAGAKVQALNMLDLLFEPQLVADD